MGYLSAKPLVAGRTILGKNKMYAWGAGRVIERGSRGYLNPRTEPFANFKKTTINKGEL